MADIPEIPGVAKALRSGPDSSGMVAAVLMAVFVVVLLVDGWTEDAEEGRAQLVMAEEHRLHCLMVSHKHV